jgi:hypothetical protein
MYSRVASKLEPAIRSLMPRDASQIRRKLLGVINWVREFYRLGA